MAKKQISGIQMKNTDIAIIGMACRFPGADDYSQFWNNISTGVNSIKQIPADRWDTDRYFSEDLESPNKSNTKWRGLVDNIKSFDNSFFNISPREANVMDPQQRMLLEEAWKCIEDSGVSLQKLQDKNTAVFIGAIVSDYRQLAAALRVETDSYACLGSFECFLANRISHVFDLKGQSVSINAACASAIAAIQEASHTLSLGESAYALAGGVNFNTHPWKDISVSKLRVFSKDGQCKSFDRDANGFVSGEGVGVLLLQKLEDAVRDNNHIYGIIKGSAINHVGKAISITAPSLDAQKNLILAALKNAEVTADTITYFEAHSTGALIGDYIEVEAASRAFREYTTKSGYCKIGSVKTNVGHLEAASGICGVIKILMMLKNKKIAPSINLQNINPMIDFEDSPFEVATELTEWKRLKKDLPLRAGVSSFGFGGVNSHVILEEYMGKEGSESSESTKSGEEFIFTVSAKTPESLTELLHKWKDKEVDGISLRDICLNMLNGRQQFQYRAGCVIKDKEGLKAFLYKAVPFDSRNGRKWCLKVGSSEEADFENISKVIKLGFVPSHIVGEKKGFWAAAAISGMLEAHEAAAYMTGSKELSEIALKRPVIPFYDAVNHRIIKPYHINEEYVQGIVRGLKDSKIEDEALGHYVNKARLLHKSQFTFKKAFDEWHKTVKGSSGINILELLYCEGLFKKNVRELDREKLILTVVIMDCLRILCRKWGLSEKKIINNENLYELLDLITDKAIEKKTVAGLLTAPSPNFKAAGLELNEKQHLIDPSRGYILLKNMNTALSDIEDAALWIKKAVLAQIPQDASENMLTLGMGKKGCTVNAGDGWDKCLLGLWLNGVDIMWNDVYPEGSYRKVPLPTYVFKKEDFWLSAGCDLAIELPIEKHADKSEAMTETAEELTEKEIEVALTDMSSRVLKVCKSGINQELSFMELGFDSINGVELIREIGRTYKIEIDAVTFYDYPTIGEMAGYIYKELSESCSMCKEQNEEEQEVLELLRMLEAGELGIV